MTGPYVVALVGAAIMAGCSGDQREPRGPLIDEQHGVYGGVRMGDSVADVMRVFGRPAAGQGFSARGKLPAEIGVPVSIPAPGRLQPILLKYEDVAFLVGPRGVYSFIVSEEGAHTRRGVAVDDDLDEALNAYDLRCADVAGGETALGVETYPSCSTTIGGEIRIWFGRDPIQSITLLSLRQARSE